VCEEVRVNSGVKVRLAAVAGVCTGVEGCVGVGAKV
jgi:hypothetical protein